VPNELPTDKMRILRSQGRAAKAEQHVSTMSRVTT
jgi:hypothetical protein